MSAQADVIASGKFAVGLPVVKRRRKTKEVTTKEEKVEEESIMVDDVNKSNERVEEGIRASEQDLGGILQQAPELGNLQNHGQFPNIDGDALEKPSLPVSPIEEPAIAQPKSHGRQRKPSTAGATKSVPEAPDDQPEDEEVPPQPKRRGRAPKTAPMKSAPVIGDSDAEETEDETGPAIAIPGAGQTDQGAAKQATRKEILGSDEDAADDAATDVIQPEPKPRGRPHKVAAEKPADGKEVQRQAAQPVLTSTPPPDTPCKPTTPQQQQARQGVATPHSPLQSGKVPYRVGLSRRTRIAPLLKIIRK